MLHCVTQPLLCFVQAEDLLYRKWSYQCRLHISWKHLLDQILLNYFCLILQLHQTWLWASVETSSLTGVPIGRLVSCPQCLGQRWLVEVALVVLGVGVFPVDQRVAAAPRTEQVVFTRLSFFRRWTLGRTRDILAWLQPKISFFSLWVFHSHFLKDHRTHLDACAVQFVIYLWYGLNSMYIFTWPCCYITGPSYTECIVPLKALG